MKKIQLTRGKVALVDDENYERINQHKWHARKGRYTYYVIRYSYGGKKRVSIHMHRFIMNCPDGKFVDHKDGNGLNNQKENLRVCNGTQNQGNRKLNKNNKSGAKGVFWRKDKNKWVSRIYIKGKYKHLGYFTDINDAKLVYTEKAKEYFGEFERSS